MTYLGRVVGQGVVRPVSAKIQAVQDYPKGTMIFVWSTARQQAFERVKGMLVNAPV